jgi:hypothetical protein
MHGNIQKIQGWESGNGNVSFQGKIALILLLHRRKDIMRIPLNISIAVAKKNRQVTCIDMRNKRMLFGKHNYMLDILKK